ncbi:MAG: tetratricopeptide repeat protein, partial [Candidatus Latescibacterota bacterium]
MARHRKKPHKPRKRRKGDKAGVGRAASPVQAGMHAFRNADYATAIDQWSRALAGAPLASPGSVDTARLQVALAEAHFRRTLAPQGDSAQALADLGRAAELAPGDGRYQYHLGLAHHRAGSLAAACAAYARAASLGYAGPGLARTRALAELERKAGLPLDEVPGLSREERAELEALTALLRRAPDPALALAAGAAAAPGTPATAGTPALSLWRGLAHLMRGDAEQGLAALSEPAARSLPPGAEAVRLLYRALAAEQAGSPQEQVCTGAEQAAAAGGDGVARRLQRSRLAAHLGRLWDLRQQEAWEALDTESQVAAELAPRHPEVLAYRLIACHRRALQDVAAGEWRRAQQRWGEMVSIVYQYGGLGQIRPLLYNLAVAAEQAEDWAAAGAAWEALLRGMPASPRTVPRRPRPRPPEPQLPGMPALPPPEVPEAPLPDAAAPAGGSVAGAPAQPPWTAAASGTWSAQAREWVRRRVLQCYRNAGEPERVVEHARKLSGAHPEDLDLRLALAEALLDNGQVQAARNEVSRILALDPRCVPGLLLLFGVEQERGRWAAAEKALRKVLALEPTNPVARQELVDLRITEGVDLFNEGQVARARRAYEEAVEMSPGHAVALCLLAEAELRLGAGQEARGHLEQAFGTGQREAFVRALRTWVAWDDDAEARAVVERARQAGLASAEFYLDAGLAVVRA